MIGSYKGSVHLEGSTHQILGDFGTLVWALVDSFSEKEVRDAFELALSFKDIKPDAVIDLSDKPEKTKKEGGKWDSLKF